MILVWLNWHPQVAKFHVLFAAVSGHQLIAAANFSTVCKSDVIDIQDCLGNCDANPQANP
jgi:hypothetical protein